MGIARCVALIFVLVSFTSGAWADSSIRVGISEGVDGLVDHSEGKLHGSLSSLYECVFEKSGLEPQYVSIPLKRGLYYLERGHLDVLLPLARTAERDDSLVFAGELIRAEYSYVSFTPLPTSLESMSLTFGLVRGFVGHVFIPESASKIEEVTSWSQLVPMLERGRIDVSVIPSMLVEEVLGERAKEAFIQRAGELAASLYISPRLELTNISFRIMSSVEACRPQSEVVSSL